MGWGECIIRSTYAEGTLQKASMSQVRSIMVIGESLFVKCYAMAMSNRIVPNSGELIPQEG